MKQAKIKIGDLHMNVKDFLYLEPKDQVLETKLRFYLSKTCCQNITSTKHNIRSLTFFLVKKNPQLGILTHEERANIQLKGFVVQGMNQLVL